MASRYGKNSAIAQYNRARKAQVALIRCEGSRVQPTRTHVVRTIDGKDTTFGECVRCTRQEKILQNGTVATHMRHPED